MVCCVFLAVVGRGCPHPCEASTSIHCGCVHGAADIVGGGSLKVIMTSGVGNLIKAMSAWLLVTVLAAIRRYSHLLEGQAGSTDLCGTLDSVEMGVAVYFTRLQ